MKQSEKIEFYSKLSTESALSVVGSILDEIHANQEAIMKWMWIHKEQYVMENSDETFDKL